MRRRPGRRSGRVAGAAPRALLAAAALAAVSGLAGCESRARREARRAAEAEAEMLALAARDSLEEATFRADSAALAASLATDTVDAALVRTRLVRYVDDELGGPRLVPDTVYAFRGRRLGYCDDVAPGLARAPGDTLTCQWVPALDTASVVAAPAAEAP